MATIFPAYWHSLVRVKIRNNEAAVLGSPRRGLAPPPRCASGGEIPMR